MSFVVVCFVDECAMTNIDPLGAKYCKPINPEAGKHGSSITQPSMITTSSIRAFSRKNRVYVFREFLLNTYKHYLSPGDVILDIAGGKGDLSWLLCNMDRFTSVVVDPRVTNSNHILKSIDYLREHPEEARIRAIPNRPTHQPLAALIPHLHNRVYFLSPKHIRILVDDELVHAVRSVKQQAEQSDEHHHVVWEAFWEVALQKGLNANPLGCKEQKGSNYSGQSVMDSQQALDLLLQTRLVVGFHPDQATDSCIDLAQALGVPFCVVPCCVFPAQFPHRRLRDGSPVRDYDGLMEYLQQKVSSSSMCLQTASLAFHETKTARNVVLYSLPRSMYQESISWLFKKSSSLVK